MGRTAGRSDFALDTRVSPLARVPPREGSGPDGRDSVSVSRRAEAIGEGGRRVEPGRRQPDTLRTATLYKEGVALSSPFLRYDIGVGKWCTVTVADGD